MSDRRLQVFHAVARQRSFTKAAETLFMTQPAVTFQIKQLEEQYNTRLFDRGHGKISLTAAGEVVLEYAEKILGLSTELELRLGEMTGQMRGPLLLGASTTIAEFMLPRVLGEFNAQFPQVRATLIVANSDAIQHRVAEHTLDVGLVVSPTRAAGLLDEVCCADELCVICAPDYPLAKAAAVDAEMLVDYEYISREPGSGTREMIDRYFRAAGVDPENLKVQMELGSPEALKGVVGTGVGFAIASRAIAAREVERGELVLVPLKPRLESTLYFVYPKERFRSRLVSAFVDFAKRRLRDSSH